MPQIKRAILTFFIKNIANFYKKYKGFYENRSPFLCFYAFLLEISAAASINPSRFLLLLELFAKKLSLFLILYHIF